MYNSDFFRYSPHESEDSAVASDEEEDDQETEEEEVSVSLFKTFD